MSNPPVRSPRIAFQVYRPSDWAAGATTTQDLLIALRALGQDCPEITLWRWNGLSDQDMEPLAALADQIVSARYPAPLQTPNVVMPTRRNSLKKISALLRPSRKTDNTTGQDARLLRNSGMDCSFSMPFENRADFSAPLLVLIFDLQHRQLPELFSPKERAQRDNTLQREAEGAMLLITMSQSVRDDLAGFTPQHSHKIRVLPWVSNIPSSVYAIDPNAVVSKYHLPERFFYLPNQFWAHKNHLVVLEALRELAQRGIRPNVVCSGSLVEPRTNQHLGQLMQKLSLWNLREQFIILGLAPRTDVFALMRQALCVLNPSKFEGFGLSAAEAISLGKRLLVSNLAALREQASAAATYFDPNNSHELAAQMEILWKTVAPGPDLLLEAQARAALPTRQKDFARAFVKLAREAIQLDAAKKSAR